MGPSIPQWNLAFVHVSSFDFVFHLLHEVWIHCTPLLFCAEGAPHMLEECWEVLPIVRSWYMSDFWWLMIPRNGPMDRLANGPEDFNEAMDTINELPYSQQPDMRHILGYTLKQGKSLGCLGLAFTLKDSLFRVISCRTTSVLPVMAVQQTWLWNHLPIEAREETTKTVYRINPVVRKKS